MSNRRVALAFGEDMKKFNQYCWVLFLCLYGFQAHALPTKDYFPEDTLFSVDTPLPEDFLGYGIGDWHISPDALTGYMVVLAAKSPRVSIETIGYSHERKAISHVYISSPENIANLDAVLKKHQNAKSAETDILVINLAYSVHGNEASGANAAPLTAYYLAASQESWIKQFLQNTVVIIEPVQNPDGLARFAVWANQHKGLSENFDSANRDHNESWPSGRTNHYWFDLNRDWIFTIHPESRARIKAYQKWRPHILGDYHEMGGDKRSYFFQPGHPKRTHPLTSKANQSLTLELARFHAEALDAKSQPYYTEERFDDFYYGKGSTYPDATGSIGLLFEQSSVRGHFRNLGGEKTRFSDAVDNQLATSLSLLRGADAVREDILGYRFKNATEQAAKAHANSVKAYIFSDDDDPMRVRKLLDIFNLHKIPVYPLTRDIRAANQTFQKNKAWVVKLNSPQYGLITSLFETRTSFDDNVFYDVSTWNLPLALGLPYAPLKNLAGVDTKALTALPVITPKAWGKELPVAYAFEWNQFRAPHLLQALMAAGLYPRLSVKPFSSGTQEGNVREFSAGTIVLQPRVKVAHKKLAEVLKAHPGVNVYGLTSGLTPTGPDLGSRDMKVLKAIKPALLLGAGVRTTDAGAVRYTVDNRFGMPLTMLDLDKLKGVDLTQYTHLLLADGSYGAWKKTPKILESWVKAGGIIIAKNGASKWLEKTIVFADDKTNESTEATDKSTLHARRAYQDYEQESGKRKISGAVLRAEADLTHPLAFGYSRANIPVFYNAKEPLLAPPVSYDTPLVFAKKELLITGYGYKKQLEKLQDTPVIALHRLGKGKIVLINSDVNFRAIWFGTEKLYANALFFSQAIESRKDEKSESKDRRN